MWRPFRRKYWVVCHLHGLFGSVECRRRCPDNYLGHDVISGPYETYEEAANYLNGTGLRQIGDGKRYMVAKLKGN